LTLAASAGDDSPLKSAAPAVERLIVRPGAAAFRIVVDASGELSAGIEVSFC
jgi:hypothetical protein